MIEGRDDELHQTVNNLYHEELERDPDPAGALSWFMHLKNGMTGEEMRAFLHNSPEAIALRAQPPKPKLLPITVQGLDFLGPDGVRTVLNGTDQFPALRMMIDGADISPLIEESQTLGFNLWRVFAQGSKKQNGFLQLAPDETGYYDALFKLCSTLQDAGIYVLLTVLADNQDIHTPETQFTNLRGMLDGLGNVLYSGGNEWTKNGFHPAELPPLDGKLWSRGSDVEDQLPYSPTGTFMEFHPRRLWPTIMSDSIASPIFIYEHRPPVPLLIDEPARMGTDGSGPQYAIANNCWRFARHYATECAGAVFHSRSGQNGVVMDIPTYDCAMAWCEGMQL